MTSQCMRPRKALIANSLRHVDPPPQANGARSDTRPELNQPSKAPRILLKFPAQRQKPVRGFGAGTYAGDSARGDERVGQVGATAVLSGLDAQIHASAGAVGR